MYYQDKILQITDLGRDRNNKSKSNTNDFDIK